MSIQQGLPSQTAPFVDGSGRMMPVWYRWASSMEQRTGGPQGVDVATVVTQVNTVVEMVDNALFLSVEDGRIAALQAAIHAAAVPLQDTGFLMGDEGRLNALVQQAAVDPGALVLLLGDAR